MNQRQLTDRDIDQLMEAQPIPAIPAGRLKSIETALSANLKPVRPMASDSMYLAAFGGIFVIACIGCCSMIGGYGWQVLSALQKLAVFAPLAMIALVLTFSIVRQLRPAATYARITAIMSAGLFLLLLLSMILNFHPARESGFIQNGLACFRTGMLSAVPAALLFALPFSRGAGLSPLLTGAAAGGLAGLVGLTVLEIHCPNLNVLHIVVWHVSVTVVCALLGFIFSSVTFRRWQANP